MRSYYIAGNWKMNLLKDEAISLAKKLVEALKDGKNKYMVAPSFTLLPYVSDILKGSKILLGSQNMGIEEKGAYTGDVSPLQLRDVGVKVVILGHSERRCIFGETDDMINKKVHLALKHGLEVILCVGEEISERECGCEKLICESQIRRGLKGIIEKDLEKITIAYEPVWAIGTGKSATPEDAENMHSFIRALVSSMYSKKAGDDMIIQYGGSMKEENAQALLNMPNINGGLIGGAALKADAFIKIASI